MSIWSRRATMQLTLLAATRRDGAIWAHLFVGSPCNIDILLRALLLDLHPSSPPSHTCLVMKQVPGFAGHRLLDPRRRAGRSLEIAEHDVRQEVQPSVEKVLSPGYDDDRQV